jgi:hypothetical protein
MAMAQHDLAGGALQLRAMLTPEPLTVGEKGYPLLLQTGEEVDGVPLHDRQHPHDLFMELAVVYERWIAGDVGLELYGGPVGEPAVGPPAFPHRVSAASDPLAVLGHHWQDSTHISFGVVTAGVFSSRWKLEGSFFNGREPDQDRYDIDLRGFDSASGRLSWNPTAQTSFQASYAYLDSPEALEPDTSQQRVVVSAQYDRRLGAGNWATLACYGLVMPSGHAAESSALVESTLDLGGHEILFGRLEVVQKTGADLLLDMPASDLDRIFGVGELVLGYVHAFPALGPLGFGLGARGAVNFLPGALERYYGTTRPIGGMVFLQLQPTPATHHHHPM